jgi:hypothetical protein
MMTDTTAPPTTGFALWFRSQPLARWQQILSAAPETECGRRAENQRPMHLSPMPAAIYLTAGQPRCRHIPQRQSPRASTKCVQRGGHGGCGAFEGRLAPMRLNVRIAASLMRPTIDWLRYLCGCSLREPARSRLLPRAMPARVFGTSVTVN